LIDRRIIQPERNKDGKYPPGPNVDEALATWSPSKTRGSFGQPLPPAQILEELLHWSDNGVEEIVGRTVFHNYGAGLNAVRCPGCLANQVKGTWSDCINDWFRGDDFATVPCQNCQESSPLTEWLFDPPWLFGHLGFEFWEWPPMKRRFIDAISRILGHKVRMVAGHI
jgi:hypothetical protein